MTTDTRTPAEIAYDRLKDGSAYVQPGLPPEVASGEMTLLRYVARTIDQAMHTTDDAPAAGSRDDVLIGHIDGCPVLAHYITDVNDPDDDSLAWATVVWNGIEISTDGRSYLNLPMTGGMGGDMEPSEWLGIKQLAQTDVCERLMAIARCYPRYRDTLTPLATLAPLVRIEPFICDDELDPRRGQELGVSFECGGSWIYFPHDDARPGIRAFDTDIPTEHVDRHLDELTALLCDPRVQTLRRSEARQ